MRRWKGMLTALMPLLALLGAAFLFDVLEAATASPLFVSAVAILGALAVSVAWLWSRRAECLLLLVPFAAVLALLTLTDTSPRKPFYRFYAALQPGMTEAEVFLTLDEQFPPTSRYPRPVVNRLIGPSHLGFILDPRDGRYDTEIVALDFEDGRLVTKQYDPD